LRDDPLRHFLLEHQRQRSPPWRPVTTEPLDQQRGPDVVGKIGDDVGATAGDGFLIDFERVGLEDLELAAELLLQLGQGGNAAAVALDRDHAGARIEQSPREPSRAGPDLVHALPLQRAGNGRDPRQQLTVEDEILAERLARGEAMPANDVTQRFG
jgi:hypothetical protein